MRHAWTSFVVIVIVVPALATAAGCSSGGNTGPYDTCEVGDCHESLDGCSEIRVEYPDGPASAGICTNLCSGDAECPLDPRGVVGACLQFSGASFATCFERCLSDADCPAGLACIDRLVDAVGAVQLLPDAVCLPR